MIKAKYFTLIILVFSFIASPVSLAHLKSDPGIPCFKMENHAVVEIANPLSVTPYAQIEYVEAKPSWVSTFDLGQAMHFTVHFRIAHCRPYNVFISPVYEHQEGIISYSSPSPAYEPGEHQGRHSAFIGFKHKSANENLNKPIRLKAIQVTITEYGTQDILAEYTHTVEAYWHSQSATVKTSEQCTDKMTWPETDSIPNFQCSNSINFELENGFKQVDALDLNNDGICELIAEVESCRKLNDNTCYKIYTEKEGHFQEIWQYYNTLRVFQVRNGYFQLGSTETGPYQDVHRLGIYDPGLARYATQRYLTPCR